ncbi:MAG: BMP family ABC transporter substrate-binding protein [Defluviitaleaceae bacterium]|nr:BMP family ABC transporter substrate-binding protein [Defluviitaleaceae bacterium]
MKKLAVIACLIFALALLVACNRGNNESAPEEVVEDNVPEEPDVPDEVEETEEYDEYEEEAEEYVAQPSGSGIRIALVTGTGGRGDESFNDMAIAGLEQAEAMYGISWEYATPPSVADFEDIMVLFAQTGDYDLIIVTSFQAQTAMYSVAEDFPDQQFAIVDTAVHMPNVRAIVKDFAEMTFLGGYLAGLLAADDSMPNIDADSNMVGIVIGTDSPPMLNAARGFAAGATLANPDVEVRVNSVGGFGDPATGREISLTLFGEGASVLMSFAGGSGAGVTLAAQELDMYAITGAFPRTADAPDNIPASVGEHLTNQLVTEIRSIIDGTWEAGIFMGTLSNDYVGISFEGSNVNVPAEMVQRVENARLRVVSGEISIPATMEEIADWAVENTATE